MQESSVAIQFAICQSPRATGVALTQAFARRLC